MDWAWTSIWRFEWNALNWATWKFTKSSTNIPWSAVESRPWSSAIRGTRSDKSLVRKLLGLAVLSSISPVVDPTSMQFWVGIFWTILIHETIEIRILCKGFLSKPSSVLEPTWFVTRHSYQDNCKEITRPALQVGLLEDRLAIYPLSSDFSSRPRNRYQDMVVCKESVSSPYMAWYDYDGRNAASVNYSSY